MTIAVDDEPGCLLTFGIAIPLNDVTEVGGTSSLAHVDVGVRCLRVVHRRRIAQASGVAVNVVPAGSTVHLVEGHGGRRHAGYDGDVP